MAMVDLLKGRWPSSRELPSEIIEFFIAQEFGWTYDYIRYGMSPKDIKITTQLMSLMNRFKSGELSGGKRKQRT